MNASDGTSRTLASIAVKDGGVEFGGFAWSPDGTRLAFTVERVPPD